MKKLLSFILICILLLALFACDNEPPAPNDGGMTNGGGEENPPSEPKANPVSDFEYAIMQGQDGIGITKYVGTSKSIVFPNTIDGLPVTVIGGHLLDGEARTLIESVVIPDTVQRIADLTFSGCENLVSVDFGKGVLEIGASAFEDCTALKKVILPPKLEAIGVRAFYGCSSVTEVFIPKTMKTWGSDYSHGSFGGCTALKQLTFEEGLETIGCWETFAGAEALERIEIPASVKKIAPLAFNACSSLTTVVFKGDVPEPTESGSSLDYVFGYPNLNANENLVIHYHPTTKGWDAVVWRDVYRLEPIE